MTKNEYIAETAARVYGKGGAGTADSIGIAIGLASALEAAGCAPWIEPRCSICDSLIVAHIEHVCLVTKQAAP